MTSTTVASPSSASALATLTRVLAQILTRSNISKALGVYILCLVIKYRKTAYGVRPRSDITGPWSVPLLGNIYQFAILPRNQILQRQVQSHEKFGKVFTMTAPGVGRFINISSPDDVDHMLRINFWAYEKGPYLKTKLKPLVGEGNKLNHAFFFSHGAALCKKKKLIFLFNYKIIVQASLERMAR